MREIPAQREKIFHAPVFFKSLRTLSRGGNSPTLGIGELLGEEEWPSFSGTLQGTGSTTMPSPHLSGQRWKRPWVLIECHSGSFPEAKFRNSCRITNGVPAYEPAEGYRPTQRAENQKQRCAPRANNGVVLRIWGSRTDPTWGFSESARAWPRPVNSYLPANMVKRNRLSFRCP